MRTFITTIIMLAAGTAVAGEAKLPAFPGAEGFGAKSVGGRGGRVIKVTNLNSKGPGSLQWACSQKGPRIVVFDVSGVIKGNVKIGAPNIYIAGQTAPGAGITIDGRLMCRGLSDLTIRFLRLRPLYGHGGGGSGDCTQLGQVDRMILDHVSVSWGNDENMDFCGCKNFTVQWCAIEPSRVAFQKSGIHNYGMIMGYVAGDATLHHNLWAHHSERAPLCGLDTVDHRNNVIYNVMWALQYHPPSKNRRGKRMYRTNLVGCYLKDGAAGPVAMRPWLPPLNRALPGIQDWRKVQIYGEKNFFAWSGKGEYSDYDPRVIREHHVKKGSKHWVEKEWEVPPVTTHDAKEAYRLVLAQSGCLPHDAVSKRTMREVRTGSGYWGRFVPKGGLMEGLKPGKAAPDSDGDGMPDAWEKAHGLDPKDGADANKTVPAGASENDRHKGYTYIEYYINECADKLIAQAMAAAKAAGDEPTSRPAPESPAAPARPAADAKTAGAPRIAVPLAAGGGHALVRRPDGRLVGWGLNWHGEIGDGTSNDHNLAVQVKSPQGLPSLAEVVEMSSSGASVVVVVKNGTLLAWGQNDLGQLGLGTVSRDQSEPARVVGPGGKGALEDVVTAAAGPYHTLAARKDGSVWAWGCNMDGRLGDGSTADRSAPVQVKGLTDIVAVAAGVKHSLALRRDGTVWAWGDNLCGQLGDATNTDKLTPVQVRDLTGVTAIAAGWFHSLALKSDGTVWTWGMNHLGQLGDGTEDDRNGSVQVRGLNGEGQLGGVKEISSGGLHNLALRDDGTLCAWGWNYCDQLGNDTGSWLQSTPVRVKGVKGNGVLKDVIAFDGGGSHSIAVLKNGTVLAWGGNGRGQNGQGWTGSICVMDGKFIDHGTFTKQKLHKKGARRVFGAPWPVTVSTDKSITQFYADKLENGEPWLRAQAAMSLAGLGARSVEALPSLIKAMGDEVAEVRQHSAWALSKIGPAAREALPALKKALPGSEGRLRSNIENAIRKIEAKAE